MHFLFIANSIDLFVNLSMQFYSNIRESIQFIFRIKYQKMNLKDRMQHQNRNNSGILNSSGYNFQKDKNEDQLLRNIVENAIYNKSRNECQEQLIKRKNELLEQKKLIDFQRKKANEDTLKKFELDYDEISRQIIKNVENHLYQNKVRILTQLKEKRIGETADERAVKSDIDELLARINTHLDGLKRDEQYREYIAKVVTTDFDSKKQDIKLNIKSLIDEKYYTCFKNDIQRVIVVDAHVRKDSMVGSYGGKDLKYLSDDINSHSNRDQLKKAGY